MDNVVATATPEPVEVVEAPKTPGKVDRGEARGGEMPLEIYEKENRTPYINELLEVDDVLPDYMKKSISTIDEYINGMINEKGYKPTTEAYKDTLEAVKKELGIDKNTTLEAMVERMTKFIQAEALLKKLKLVDEEKILKQLKKDPQGDPMSLVMRQIEKAGL